MEMCKICGYKDRWWKPKWLHLQHNLIRVTDLNEMKLSELSDEDYLFISDISDKTSKKIKILTLIQYFNKPV
jgi:hypothetical protein